MKLENWMGIYENFMVQTLETFPNLSFQLDCQNKSNKIKLNFNFKLVFSTV